MTEATSNHWALRRRIQALCDSPIAGEAASARRQLARLEARYSFVVEPVGTDIFNMSQARVVAGDARLLFAFEFGETDVAMMAKHAIEQRFRLNAAIRTVQWKTSVWVDAAPESMPALQTVATTIRSHFVRLWQRLTESSDVTVGDRSAFMRGLYDGMMDEERKAGERLPARRAAMPAKVSKRRGKKAVAIRPALGVHPYELALPLGRNIRFAATVEENESMLADAIGGHLEEKAA